MVSALAVASRSLERSLRGRAPATYMRWLSLGPVSASGCSLACAKMPLLAGSEGFPR